MRQMTRSKRAGGKKKGSRATFSGSRGWIAAGTLAVYGVMGGAKSSLAAKALIGINVKF